VFDLRETFVFFVMKRRFCRIRILTLQDYHPSRSEGSAFRLPQTSKVARPRFSSCRHVILFLPALLVPSLAFSQPRVVHVYVALADNRHQGIVPVPAKLGNGDDPAHNLYWGATYGVKTFFSDSAEWQLVKSENHPKDSVLERCIFKHHTADVYLVADAYQGSRIRDAVADFLDAAAGGQAQTIQMDEPFRLTLPAGGSSALVVYVGHDGLMDFQAVLPIRQRDHPPPLSIVLACASKTYFGPYLREAGAKPLLWTTGLMAPEAYILNAALAGWIAHETPEQIRSRAAKAYDQYQKCGLTAAMRLFSAAE
jgi:hypothetical protein